MIGIKGSASKALDMQQHLFEVYLKVFCLQILPIKNPAIYSSY